jgi:hypothetical protein
MDNKDKKPKNTLEKVLLGLVIGGAVGSVMSNKNLRENLGQKFKSGGKYAKDLVKKTEKSSIWHRINKFFFKK